MEEVAYGVTHEIELVIDGKNVKETIERYFDKSPTPLVEIRRIH